ncbi:MAG: ParB/RepB/Spo0J family partition protein [Lachnospiraceae bacterium]|nr:ParB/RepB/Spo0J family partition protein [Lachnospiraceae bacterium]
MAEDKTTQNKKKNRLGKGLDGLIVKKIPAAPVKSEVSAAPAEEGIAVMVPIEKLERNKNQPRRTFDEESIAELSDSIKRIGVVDPILVKDRGDHYEIIGGERRWRASKKAGLKEVPVRILDLSEEEIAVIALIENLQREDLNPIDEALAYKNLKDRFSLTDDQVAERVSKSRVTVTNSLRLLKLDERVRQMVIDKKLTTGHVRPLIMIEDADKQTEIAQTAVDMKLSVREVEKLVKSFRSAPKAKTKKDLSAYQLQYDEYAGRITEKLGTKVSVSLAEKDKGKLEIEFYSSEDFERFYGILTGNHQ